MATNILMPALSPTMTEGTLARWLKQEGDTIKSGDVIAEIETDKATMEVEAVDEGVLGKILVPDGTQGVKVNDPIAVLVQAGEAAGAAPKPAPKQEAGETAAAVQNTPVAPAVAVSAQVPTPVKANGHAGDADRVFASPLARRMAQQAGIDLASVHGSGPQGRIVRADIEALQGCGAAPAPVATPLPVARPMAPITAAHQKIPLSNVKKITARRLTEAKQTIPHFYVSIDVELDALLKLRGDLNARSPKDGVDAFKLSVNDLLIKACAVTLRRVPKVNVSFTDEALILYNDVDISVAVSIPDGLITPIIRQADRKSVVAISNEAKTLIERARSGRLKPEEFQGGGFSISNMGMYGVREFAAIINPPQAAILAVAAGGPRAVVKDGQLAVANVMTVTLSVDHRAIDGALAAEFVAAFRAVVEDPLSLLL
jgi:pyruvate dehydrogenase E2 component (dihydrolipoamide acetyltransferase)